MLGNRLACPRRSSYDAESGGSERTEEVSMRNGPTFPRRTGVAIALAVAVFCPAASEAGEVKPYEHTYAANDRYRVVLLTILPGMKLGLQVLEYGGKVVWETQPSSSRIKVSLEHGRIVVLTKVYGSGVVSMDKEGPMRGGKVFTLTGEKVGDLPPSVHEGECVGPVFLANRTGGGIIAYDLESAKELWRNEELGMNWASLAGPCLLSLRWYDHQKEGYENRLLDLRTGKVVYQVSSPRDENVKVLAVSASRIVTVRTVMEGAGAAHWKSALLDRAGRKVAEIRWQGMPVEAAFSPDETKLAAVCASPSKDAGEGLLRYVLEVYTVDGKRLQQETLLSVEARTPLLEASIIFDSNYVRARLTRKVDVLVKKAR
jgi:hypothetical protein